MNELIRVTLVRSPIGTKERVRQTLRGLGLGKVGSSHILKRTPEVEGMLRRVPHLVAATEAPLSLSEQTAGDRGSISDTGERQLDNTARHLDNVTVDPVVEVETIITADADPIAAEANATAAEAVTSSANAPMTAEEKLAPTSEEAKAADHNSGSISTDETE
jgi:large subunit ribosomal protein L30